MRSPSSSKSAFILVRREEQSKSRALPVRASAQETPGYGGEGNVSAQRKSNERHLPVLRHQINFTLSHLAATVMSFIHPFPCSHGNSAAWSCLFFYICLSPSPSTSLPLSRSQWTQPTYSIWGGTVTTPASLESTPSSLLLHCGAGVQIE